MRRWLRPATILLLTATMPATASAFSTGIVGYSGKNRGIICNACHTGGTAPTVGFEGPTSAEPGAILTFRFVIQSQSASQTAAGFNVAASAGTLQVVAGQGEQKLGVELTHTTPKANDGNGQAAFSFSWTAPAAAGSYTLFAAGNSVTRNGNERAGDKAANTTLVVEVAAAPTPTPTEPAVPTATATATETVTPPQSTCVGDCGADGEVTVDELITGVNIALGTTDLPACTVFDANGDGEVTIDELLLAVNATLNGCP